MKKSKKSFFPHYSLIDLLKFICNSLTDLFLSKKLRDRKCDEEDFLKIYLSKFMEEAKT